MDLKYSNACKEVLELFNYFLDESDLSKIPQSDIDYMRKNANAQFIYVIDETKTLEEQRISKEAKAMILSIYQKYFATEDQNIKIKEILYLNQKKEEQEKREKYNPDDIFKKINKDKNINMETPDTKINAALIEYKELIFVRFKNFIFKILRINK